MRSAHGFKTAHQNLIRSVEEHQSGVTTSAQDKRITYALRPEKLIVTTEQPTTDHNWSVGKVHDIAYLGGHSVFYVELPSGMVVQSFVANAERRGARPTG